jgi:hypothetical protein
LVFLIVKLIYQISLLFVLMRWLDIISDPEQRALFVRPLANDNVQVRTKKIRIWRRMGGANPQVLNRPGNLRQGARVTSGPKARPKNWVPLGGSEL